MEEAMLDSPTATRDSMARSHVTRGTVLKFLSKVVVLVVVEHAREHAPGIPDGLWARMKRALERWSRT
jgi:hypothetical protein